MARLSIALLILGLSSAAWAQAGGENRDRNEKIPSVVRQAIDERFPGARLELIGAREHQVDNVKVYNVRISADGIESRTTVTEYGDFLQLNYPPDMARQLPPPVSALVDQLFTRRPESITQYERVTYLVNGQLDNRDFRAEINAVGGLWDLKSYRQLRQEQPSNWQRASRDEEDRLLNQLQRYFTDPRIATAYQYPDTQNFYWIEFNTRRDRNVRALMNTSGELAWYRIPVEQEQLPSPVKTAIRDYLRSVQVNQIYRNHQVLYDVEHTSPGGAALRITMTPTGEVLRVLTSASEQLDKLNQNTPDEQPRLFRLGQ